MVVQIKKTKKRFLLMIGAVISLCLSFFIIRTQERTIGTDLLSINSGIVNADAVLVTDGGGSVSDGSDGCDGCGSDGCGGGGCSSSSC